MCVSGLRFAFPVHTSLLFTWEGESLAATPNVLHPAICPRAMEMSWHWASSQNMLRLAGSRLSSLALLQMLLNQKLTAEFVVQSRIKALHKFGFYCWVAFFVFTADLPLLNFKTLRAFFFFYFPFNFCHAYPRQAEAQALGHCGFIPQGVIKPDENTQLFPFSL